MFESCLPIQTTPLDKKRAQGKDKNGLKKKKKETSCKQEMVEQTFQCLWRKVMTAKYPEAKASVVNKADILPISSQ